MSCPQNLLSGGPAASDDCASSEAVDKGDTFLFLSFFSF